MHRLLVIDLGGTHVRWAVAQRGTSPTLGPVRVSRPTGETTLLEVLGACSEEAGPTAALALAIAGPVRQARGTWTHRSWQADAAQLTEALGLPVLLYNDLEAAAHGLRTLGAMDLRALCGTPSTGGSKLVLAPGTGLGAAIWHPGGLGGAVTATEAGHASLPRGLSDATEALVRSSGQAHLEALLSGPGLFRLYQAACTGDHPTHETPEQIVRSARDSDDPEATRCVEAFVELLSATTRDLLLSTGCTGGAYLSGGLVRALEPWVSAPAFAERTVQVRSLPHALDHVPVSLVTAPHLALRGLARAGMMTAH